MTMLVDSLPLSRFLCCFCEKIMHKLLNFISVSDGHTVLDTRPTTLLNAWDVFTQLRVFTLLFFYRFWLGSLLGLCNMLSQFPFLITLTRDIAQQGYFTLIVFTNLQLAMLTLALVLSSACMLLFSRIQRRSSDSKNLCLNYCLFFCKVPHSKNYNAREKSPPHAKLSV